MKPEILRRFAPQNDRIRRPQNDKIRGPQNDILYGAVILSILLLSHDLRCLCPGLRAGPSGQDLLLSEGPLLPPRIQDRMVVLFGPSPVQGRQKAFWLSAYLLQKRFKENKGSKIEVVDSKPLFCPSRADG